MINKKNEKKDYLRSVFSGMFGGVALYFLILALNYIQEFEFSILSVIIFSLVGILLAICAILFGWIIIDRFFT